MGNNYSDDFITDLEKMLPKERVEKARKEAEKTLFLIKLSELRKEMGIRQEDISEFSQSSISRIESRKDMKVTTLIEYLMSIGLGMEIKVYPKKKNSKNKEVILLKT